MLIFLSHIQPATAFSPCSIHWLSHSQSSVWISGVKKSYFLSKKIKQSTIAGYLESKIQTIMSTSATLSFSCPPHTFLFCWIVFFPFRSISSYQQHLWKHVGVSKQMNYFFRAFFSAWLHKTQIHEAMSSHTDCHFNLCPKVFKSHGGSSGERRQQEWTWSPFPVESYQALYEVLDFWRALVLFHVHLSLFLIQSKLI